MPEVKSEQPDIAKGPDAGVEPEVDAPDEASVEPSSEELPEVVELDLGELQTQLREMTAKAESNWNEVLRARAEMDNLRKRHERELDGARKFALEGFVGELLQVREHEKALEVIHKLTDGIKDAYDKLKKLLTTLKAPGV